MSPADRLVNTIHLHSEVGVDVGDGVKVRVGVGVIESIYLNSVHPEVSVNCTITLNVSCNSSGIRI